ncbi:unnamed protein product, partial [Polarella glacialis]
VDPYAVLGLNRGGSLEPAALKKAYRQAALKWHPDKVAESQKEEAEQRFVEIAWAYEVLGDPARRGAYDKPGGHGEGMPPPRDFSMEKAAKVFKDVFGDTSNEYHDLINHLAVASAQGSQEEWRRHAQDLAKAMRTNKGGKPIS